MLRMCYGSEEEGNVCFERVYVHFEFFRTIPMSASPQNHSHECVLNLLRSENG